MGVSTVPVDYFKLIPDVVWAAVAASLITLLGVFLSDRANLIRLRAQHQHDERERVKERTAVLRRDVYLRTVAELTRASAHLANLPQLDALQVNIAEGLQGFFSAAAQLQLVGEPKTALLVGKLQAAYSELYLDLIEHLTPIWYAKSAIAIADEYYSHEQKEISQLFAKMNARVESGAPDAVIMSTLQQNLDFHQGQLTKYAHDRAAAGAQAQAHIVAYQRILLTGMGDIGLSYIPALIAARKDLGLCGDLEEIELQMRSQYDRQRVKLEAIISRLGS
ncbi:hypothetical protein EKD00_09180 [Chlorobium phaeovibrioides]|uniref:hypothetical protein n=1 Tax=Chlorobium phaeovibrioides TaxID=1094 RepID=UPI000F82D952|nr:hypothetical protein [Chlorobium phaeovibrioides]RTY33693.1 hypothetical protein EKD00_09180 [Chlorobium phaeovibrioides]